MGIFNKLFGSDKQRKEEKVLPWIPLTTISQLEEIKNKSKVKTQVIYKHSTRCHICTIVVNQLVESYDLDNNIDLYYLDILSFREVSNAIAEQFQVLHESPQLIIIKNGETVAHASHGQINTLDLKSFQ